jgi:SAM-dependent methyltransferase
VIVEDPSRDEICDVVARTLQECQNGLLSSAYTLSFSANSPLLEEIRPLLARYAESIAATLVVRPSGVDVVVAPFAIVTVETAGSYVSIFGHGLDVTGCPEESYAGQAWPGDNLASEARRVLSTSPDDARKLVDAESKLLAVVAADRANEYGHPSVPGFVRRDSLKSRDAGETVVPTSDGRFTEVWESRITVDEYALFESTHPAYGAQMVSIYELARENLSSPPESLLEVGSGPGLPTLMLAELFPNAHIDAIEPSRAAFPHLVRNTAGMKVTPHNLGIAEYPAVEEYSLSVSVGSSHHLDTRLFLRCIARATRPGGVVVVADEMISEFATPQQRTRNIIDHHMRYIDVALAHIDADTLPSTEQKRLYAFRSVERHSPEALRRLLDLVREDRGLHYGSAYGPWERVRFAVLELEALVAGIDYDVERKTYPRRFRRLAEAEGLRLLAHQRVYATTGASHTDAGTHVFAFRRT